MPPLAESRKRLFRWSSPCHLIAIGFGAGLSPWMPGTMGSLAALPFWWLLASCSPLWYGILLLVAFLLGIVVCERLSVELATADPPWVVWDEFVGLWLTLWALPALQWPWVAVGFALFRLFDITKPWPIGWVDRRVPGGLGIMLDDVLAGGLAALLLKAGGYGWQLCCENWDFIP